MGFDAEVLLAKATDSLVGSRSFGPVVEQNGCTVIPAAWVIGGGGGGGGEGPAEGEHAGSGSGGGYFSISWPIGAYVVKDGQARWVPAIDGTRVLVVALSLAAAFVGLRGKRTKA